MVTIKPRHEILDDIIRDAKKHPQGWKAVYGNNAAQLSQDYYLFHPSSGIYLIKEYHKNPFVIRGLGGKIARKIDDDIEAHLTSSSGKFGILQADMLRLADHLKQGMSPSHIFQQALLGHDDTLGLTVPLRGHMNTSQPSFSSLREILATKQAKIDETFGKLATTDGLYRGYD
jgi:hypothetical protein